MIAPASVIETKQTTADGTVYSALLISGEILVLQAYNQGEPIEKVRQSFCFEDEKKEEDYCKGIESGLPPLIATKMRERQRTEEWQGMNLTTLHWGWIEWRRRETRRRFSRRKD